MKNELYRCGVEDALEKFAFDPMDTALNIWEKLRPTRLSPTGSAVAQVMGAAGGATAGHVLGNAAAVGIGRGVGRAAAGSAAREQAMRNFPNDYSAAVNQLKAYGRQKGTVVGAGFGLHAAPSAAEGIKRMAVRHGRANFLRKGGKVALGVGATALAAGILNKVLSSNKRDDR